VEPGLSLSNSKEYLVEQLEEDGGSNEAKTEVEALRHCCQSITALRRVLDLRTDHESNPSTSRRPEDTARKPLSMAHPRLSVTPKCQLRTTHATSGMGPHDFCEDWVGQLHQLG
jgi:hypothetical protein